MLVRKWKGPPSKTCGFEESLIRDLPELLQAFERVMANVAILLEKEASNEN